MTDAVRVPIPGPLDGERVDRVVAFLASVPRAEAAELIVAGAVVVDGRIASSKSQRVVAGQVLEVALPDEQPVVVPEPAVALKVVHADEAVVVIDKPAGLVVHPGAGHASGTLVHGLLARFPDMLGQDWPDPGRPGVVHRLDKGTSGLLMAARTLAAQKALARQLAQHSVDRRYVALVRGVLAHPAGIIDAPIGRSTRTPTRMAVSGQGRRAVTRYEVVQCWDEPAVTLVRCALETGRTHQIRVHLAAIGHPVVGDARYRGAAPESAFRLLPSDRPFLHAQVLGFDHPETAARLRFESPLPADLQGVLDALG